MIVTIKECFGGGSKGNVLGFEVSLGMEMHSFLLEVM